MVRTFSVVWKLDVNGLVLLESGRVVATSAVAAGYHELPLDLMRSLLRNKRNNKHFRKIGLTNT